MEWQDIDVADAVIDFEVNANNFRVPKYIRDMENPLEMYSKEEFRCYQINTPIKMEWQDIDDVADAVIDFEVNANNFRALRNYIRDMENPLEIYSKEEFPGYQINTPIKMEWQDLDDYLEDFDDVADAVNANNFRVPKKYIRDMENPLEMYSKEEFRCYQINTPIKMEWQDIDDVADAVNANNFRVPEKYIRDMENPLEMYSKEEFRCYQINKPIKMEWQDFDDVADAVNANNFRVPKKYIRDMENPLEMYSKEEFRCYQINTPIKMEWQDIDDVADAVNANNFRVPKKYIRDMENPLEMYSEEEFRRRFRFGKASVVEVLLPIVNEALLKPSNKGLPLPNVQKLLLALRYYATGNIQQVCGDLYGVSQTTAGDIIHTVSRLFVDKLPEFVVLPTTEAECHSAMRWFHDAGGFPGVVGCVDGTHIPIKNPGGLNAEIYRNRHGNFSMNVQLTAGANMCIVDIVCRRGGSFHDATIFEASGLCAVFEEGLMHQGLLLGDSGYPCLPYLFTPILDPQTVAERQYNATQIRTRNCVDRTIGVWKRRFRCLTNTLETTLDHTSAIITATSVLHNIARRVNDDLPEDEFSWVAGDVEFHVASARENQGHLIRQEFIRTHFTD